MLRLLLLLLILANLLFFVWAQGYLGLREDGREPQRLAMQIAAEKLQVAVLDPTAAAVKPADESCLLVSALSPGEAQRLIAQAKEKLPELKLVLKPGQAPKILYWVYVPPLPNKFSVDRKLAELKRLGLSNVSVMPEEGEDKFAISLGLFKTDKEAQEYFQDLLKRGVKSARVQVRESLLDGSQLEVRGPTDLLAKQLPDLLGGQAAAKTTSCPTVP